MMDELNLDRYAYGFHDEDTSVYKSEKGLRRETIEEIFVNIAKPFQFDPEVAENTVFKREIPDVRSAFHIMNYQKYYKATIQNDQLRQAFLYNQRDFCLRL